MPDRRKKEDSFGGMVLHYLVVLIVAVPVYVAVRTATNNFLLALVAGCFMLGLIQIFLEVFYMRMDQYDQFRELRDEIAELKKQPPANYNSKGEKVDIQS